MMNSRMGLLFLLMFLISNDIQSILPVSISTPEYLVVNQGMDLLLNCTFDYQEHIQMHNVKLEWFYIPNGGTEENSFCTGASVYIYIEIPTMGLNHFSDIIHSSGFWTRKIFFYYQNLSTVAQDSKFTQRLKWVGDIRKKNGSILISDMSCTDNGNFICDLRIPRVSSQVYKSKTHLIVLCEDSMRSRAMNSHVSKEVIPKNIIYTSAGISTIFIALSVILVIIWKHPSCTPPRNQSICDPPGRNETGALENIKETDGYFTVTRQPALLSNKESIPTEKKQNEETKKDEDEIYVTMHAFLGTGKSDKPAS